MLYANRMIYLSCFISALDFYCDFALDTRAVTEDGTIEAIRGKELPYFPL